MLTVMQASESSDLYPSVFLGDCRVFTREGGREKGNEVR